MHIKSNKFEQHKTDVANHKVDTAAPSDFAKMVDEKLNTKGEEND